MKPYSEAISVSDFRTCIVFIVKKSECLVVNEIELKKNEFL